MGFHLYRRIAQEHPPRRRIGEYLRRAPGDYIVADKNVVVHPALPAQHHPIPDPGRSGNTNLPAQKAIPPDLNVVADVDEVIQLGPRSDQRIAHRAPVDAHVRADFHIIPDCYGPKRMDARPALVLDVRAHAKGFADLLDPRFLGRDKTEAIGPDHSPWLAVKAVANGDPRPDARPLQDQGIRADLRPFGNRRMTGDPRTPPDHHTRANHHERPDRRTIAQNH